MIYDVIGYRIVDYVNKDQRRICGREFYLGFVPDSKNVVGQQTISLFMSDNKYDSTITIGDEVSIEYDLGRNMQPYPASLYKVD